MSESGPVLEDLLAPISEDHPAGEDITLAPEWQVINEARRKDKVFGRQNADWPRIQQLLGEALTQKSKDLRLAVWLIEANLKLLGFRGLRDGLLLLRGLMVSYWESGLYPEIEANDLQFRAMPLDYFGGDNLPLDLRQIPLTARTDGGRDYSYLDFRQSRSIGWEKDVRNSLGDIDAAKEEKRKVVLAAGGVSAEMFEEAVKNTRRASVEATRITFDEAWDALQQLNRTLDEKFQPDVPGITDTKEAFEDCRRLLEELLKRKRQEEPDPAPDGATGAIGKAPASGVGSFSIPASFISDGSDTAGSWARAEELVSQGKVAEGLVEMTQIASQQYGRVNFQHRLRLAEICLAIDRKRLAIAVLEDLAKTIDELHLDKWEAPALLARVWGRLYRCYKDAEPDSDQAKRAVIRPALDPRSMAGLRVGSVVEPFDVRVTPSLLDRLTDHSPGARWEAPLTRLQAMRVLKSSLWRDLSALLNTKRREEEVPEQFIESNRSLLTYGLPDFSSYGLKGEGAQNRLRRAIEATIRRFEPRLENVTVSLEPLLETDRSIRFRVDAFLRVEPAPEPVSFETLLQPESGRFVVVGENR